jgi:hypothetical protein
MNEEAIAIHQDPSGKAGICGKYYDPWHCMYKKALSDGSIAVLLLNRCHGGGNATIEAAGDLNIPAKNHF